MAKKTKNILKGYFETGDVPNQSQYANLIDSSLNLAEGGTQILSGSMSASLLESSNNIIAGTHITASGNISASGKLTATSLNTGQGDYELYNMNQNVTTTSSVTFNNITASINLKVDGDTILGNASSDTNTIKGKTSFIGNITASGNISASGTIYADSFESTGGDVDGIKFTDDLNIIGNITASNNISASGTITSKFFIGDGSGLTNITSTVQNVTTAVASIATGSIYVSGSVTYTSGSTNILLGIETSGSILPSKNSEVDLGSPTKYWKNLFVTESKIQSASITHLEVNNIISANNISASGTITATSYVGTLATAAQTQITSIGTLIAGNVTAILPTGILSSSAQLPSGILSSSTQIATEISGALSTTAVAALGGNYYSSSLQTLTNITASGDISASGTIISNQLQSFGSSVNTLVGSTAIGGFVPPHPSNVLRVEGASKFASHITASANISASGDVYADDYFVNNVSSLDNNGTLLRLGYNNTHTKISLGRPLTTTQVDIEGNITSSGNISSSGTLIANEANIIGHITASGNISASALITANAFTGSNFGGGNFVGSIFNANQYRISNSRFAVPGINANNFIIGDDAATGARSLTLLHITASGNISASGTIKATSYIGLPSGILSSSAQLPSGVLSSSAQLPSGIFSSSAQFPSGVISSSLFTNITASNHLSASSIIYANQYVIQNRNIIDYNHNTELTRIAYNNDTTKIHIGRTGVTTELGLYGQITASGNISSSGNIIANTYDARTSGIGYKLSGARTIYTHNSATIFGGTAVTAITGSSIMLGRTAVTHVTASGNISSSGNILTSGNVTALGTMGGSNLSGTNTGDQNLSNLAITSSNVLFANITASGNISASGTIYASKIIVSEITSSFITSSTTILVQNFTSSGDANFKGNVTASGNISSSGDIKGLTITTPGNITGSTIEGQTLIADVFLSAPSASITNLTNTNITSSGNISGSTIVGSLLQARVNLTSPLATIISGSFTNINTVNITASNNISSSNKLYANEIFVSSNIQIQNQRITYVNDDLTFLDTGLNVQGGSITASGNISASGTLTAGTITNVNTTNVTASGNISASGTIYASKIIVSEITSSFITSSTTILVQNFTSSGDANFKGNVTASGNISSSGTLTANTVISQLATIIEYGNISASSGIITRTITASGNISASGTITGATGSFAFIRGHISASVVGGHPITIESKTIFQKPITSSHISSSGLISGLSGSFGNLSFQQLGSININGNITASGNISASGYISASNINLTGGGKIKWQGETQFIQGQDNNIVIDGDSFVNIYAGIGTLVRGGGYLHAYSYIKTDSYISASNYVTARHITASSNISASGTVTAEHVLSSDDIVAQGNISSSGNLYGNEMLTPYTVINSNGLNFVNGTNQDVERIYWDGTNVNILVADKDIVQISTTGADGGGSVTVDGHITASGNISSSGTITATHIVATTQVTAANIGVTNNIVGQGNTVLGNAITDTHTFTGHITSSNNISSSGLISGLSGSFQNLTINSFGQITSSDNISSSGNITGKSGSFDYISFRDNGQGIIFSGSAGSTGSMGHLIVTNNSIQLGGTTFKKVDVDNLKSGKPLDLETSIGGFGSIIRPQAIMSALNETDYQKWTVEKRLGTFLGGDLVHDMNFAGPASAHYIQIGKTNTANIQIKPNTGQINITGSVNISGSSTLSNWGNFRNRFKDRHSFQVTTDPTVVGGWRYGLATPHTGSAPHLHFMLTGSGKVGVGTLSPQHTLHVSESSPNFKALQVEGQSQFNGFVATMGMGNATTITSNTSVPPGFNVILYTSNNNPSITIPAGINYTVNAGADVIITNMNNI